MYGVCAVRTAKFGPVTRNIPLICHYLLQPAACHRVFEVRPHLFYPPSCTNEGFIDRADSRACAAATASHNKYIQSTCTEYVTHHFRVGQPSGTRESVSLEMRRCLTLQTVLNRQPLSRGAGRAYKRGLSAYSVDIQNQHQTGNSRASSKTSPSSSQSWPWRFVLAGTA